MESCGALALQSLQHGTGEVLAVLASSVYLANPVGVLCLLPAASGAGPINLTGHYQRPTALVVGAQWQFSQQLLSIDQQAIANLQQTPVWQPAAHPNWTPARLRQTLIDASAALAELQCDAPLPAVTRILDRGALALGEWLAQHRAGTPGDPADAVTALIGCGDGLTPAGDDYLTGFLIALHSVDQHRAGQQLTAHLQNHVIQRTSRISAAHLLAACRGMASEYLHNFIYAVMANNRPALQSATDQLRSYGHSSGYYAARGAIDALTIIAE